MPTKLPPDLPVFLFLLCLSLLFEAFLRRLLVFLYPFTFLFHHFLLSLVFLCLGPSLLWKKVDNRPNFCFGTLPTKIGTLPQFLLPHLLTALESFPTFFIVSRLRLLPFDIFNRLKIFIVRIDFAETMIFHKDSIVGVNKINILPRIKDQGVCKDIFIRNE